MFVLGGRNVLISANFVRSVSSSTANNDAVRKALIDKIVRVDHAGELGATYIYKGQMAVLGKTKSAPFIQEMWDHEKEHLVKFEELLIKYNVRPTVLVPLWRLAGFTLGAGCALMGEKGAMACTVAVEALVMKHYDDQVVELEAHDKTLDRDLIDIIRKFRDDERHHHDVGLANGAEDAPLYGVMRKVIGAGCTGAIWMSERI